jgi:hypothetical protein
MCVEGVGGGGGGAGPAASAERMCTAILLTAPFVSHAQVGPGTAAGVV